MKYVLAKHVPGALPFPDGVGTGDVSEIITQEKSITNHYTSDKSITNDHPSEHSRV